MATVNEILQIADSLRAKIDQKRALQADKAAVDGKRDRIVADLAAINAQIDTIKTQLKTAAAALE